MATLGFLCLLHYVFKVASPLILTLPTEVTFRGLSWAALHCREDGTSEAKLHLFLHDFSSPPGTGCCILAHDLVLWDILSAFPCWHGVLHHCSGKTLTAVHQCRYVISSRWRGLMKYIPVITLLPSLRSNKLAEDNNHVLHHNFHCFQQV